MAAFVLTLALFASAWRVRFFVFFGENCEKENPVFLPFHISGVEKT